MLSVLAGVSARRHEPAGIDVPSASLRFVPVTPPVIKTRPSTWPDIITLIGSKFSFSWLPSSLASDHDLYSISTVTLNGPTHPPTPPCPTATAPRPRSTLTRNTRASSTRQRSWSPPGSSCQVRLSAEHTPSPGRGGDGPAGRLPHLTPVDFFPFLALSLVIGYEIIEILGPVFGVIVRPRLRAFDFLPLQSG